MITIFTDIFKTQQVSLRFWRKHIIINDEFSSLGQNYNGSSKPLIILVLQKIVVTFILPILKWEKYFLFLNIVCVVPESIKQRSSYFDNMFLELSISSHEMTYTK